MNGYSLALFAHLSFMLLAVVAATLTTFATVRLQRADDVRSALEWSGLIQRAVRAFPIAVVGLLATGVYMTHAHWAWSVPWIDAALVGLIVIVILGNVVEAPRGRALARELTGAGLTPRARRLMRDPVSWAAKMTTHTLVLAVVWLMSAKPGTEGSVVALTVALLGGVALSLPAWRRRESSDTAPVPAAR